MLYCVLFFNGTHVRNFVFVFVCICIFLLSICVFPIFGILWTQLVVQQWNPCEWVARTPLVTRSPSWRHFLLHLRNTNISASKYKLNANYVAHMGFTSYHWLQNKTAADATFCKWHPPGAQEKAWGQICPPWVLKVQKVLGWIGLMNRSCWFLLGAVVDNCVNKLILGHKKIRRKTPADATFCIKPRQIHLLIPTDTSHFSTVPRNSTLTEWQKDG